MLAKYSAPEAPRFHFFRVGLSAKISHWNEFPLTQISAPAGYGKTTLAADCLRNWKGTKCWIALDEADSDPGRFLATLAQGLSRCHPVLKAHIGQFATGNTIPDSESLLSSLLLALDALPCQLVTVLDDCAYLTSPPVRRLAVRFLSSLPGHIRFILLTRDPSVLPISRWRLRQEVLEIGTQDLALTVDEFDRWLQARLDIRVSVEARDRLHLLFEGWLAGLQLLALKLERAQNKVEALEAMDPGHQFLFEYLLQEVLEHLPREWRQFLLETSILQNLQPELCNEVVQANNSALLLNVLHQSQCFLVPLSGGGGYRYHRLFAESLRGLLQQRDAGAIPTLHRRAARWYLRRGHLEASLEHALSAEDGDTLEALAARALENLLRNSEFATLQRHIGRIPEKLCAGRPWLSIFSAWAFFHGGLEQFGEARLRELERILSQTGDPGQWGRPGHQALWAHMYLLKGMMARCQGGFGAAKTWISKAGEVVPPEALFLRASIGTQAGVLKFLQGELDGAETEFSKTLAMSETAGHHLAYFGAVYTLSEIFIMQGRLAEAGHLLDGCELRLGNMPDTGGAAAGYARIARARWLRVVGRREEAKTQVAEGIKAGLVGGNIRILNYGYATAAILQLDEGQSELALENLEKAERFGMRNRMHWAVDLDNLRAMRIRCLGPNRERPSADAWMAREQSELRRPEWMNMDLCRSACLILEWRGDYGDLSRLASRWADAAMGNKWIYAAREFEILAARGSRLHGRGPDQLRHMQAADALAERMGLLGIESNGRDLKAASARSSVQANGANPAAIRKTSSTPFDPLPANSSAQPEANTGAEPILSDREIEVLKAMREGKSNKEIAGSLFVAPSTVKSHLKNIFVKLEVNNRLLAVTRAVESGILR